MSFYEMDQKIKNRLVVKQFIEAVLQEPEVGPPGITSYPTNKADKPFIRVRQQGRLKEKDPLHQYAQDAPNFNIVWITGMWSGIWPGTGKYKQLLEPLGYNVQVVRTFADMKSAGLGRIVRHIGSKWVQNLHQNWTANHLAKNQEKVSKDIGDSTPDLIIGSSQGGAISLSVAPRYPDTPMLLLCPAWKIFGVTPTYMNPKSIIIHGIHDIEVPIADSVELQKMFNVRLIQTQDSHIMREGLSLLVRLIHSFASTENKTECTDNSQINLWLV